MQTTFDMAALPPLPTVTIKVLQYNPDAPTASVRDMERIVSPDEAISAELLRVANSALYGRSGKIKTLKEAITLLGLKTVKNLVILLSTRNMNKALQGVTYRKFLHEYPVVTALIAFDLCKPLGFPELRNEAFLSGLLHKIGMTLIALGKKEHYAYLIETAERNGAEVAKLEQQRYATNHLEVGREIFLAWKLPEEFQTMVHKHMFDIAEIEGLPKLVIITALASLIAKRFMKMFLSEIDLDREKKSFEYLKANEQTIDSFNDTYFEILQGHPFLEVI